MSTIVTQKFVLVGPHAGKSIKLGSSLNPYVFKDGVYEVEGDIGTVAAIGQALRNFYSAVPEAEAEKAQATYEAEQAALKKGVKAPAQTPAADADDADDDDTETKPAAGKKAGGKK